MTWQACFPFTICIAVLSYVSTIIRYVSSIVFSCSYYTLFFLHLSSVMPPPIMNTKQKQKQAKKDDSSVFSKNKNGRDTGSTALDAGGLDGGSSGQSSDPQNASGGGCGCTIM